MKTEQTYRIGIYGGSFDPIHRAHLVLAETAVEALGLDKVIFIPSGGIAHYKTDRQITDGNDRITMIQKAIEGKPKFEADPYEINRTEFTYTIQTLQHFREIYPKGTEIYLLIGGDWKNKLSTWKDGDVLVKEFNIALFSRPGFNLSEKSDPLEKNNFTYVQMPLLDLASSDIRDRIKQGLPVEEMLPESVWEYIQQQGLYR